MKMLRLSLTFAACLLILMADARASDSLGNDLLDTNIAQISLKRPTIQKLLITLSEDYEVPIGLETAPVSSEETADEVQWENKSLRQILDLTVGLFPKYDWIVVDGVINVVPRDGRDEILDKSVKSFSYQGESTYELRKALSRIPEIKILNKQTGSSFISLAFSLDDFGGLPKGFSLVLRDTSLRAILNSLLSNSQKNFWVVGRSGEKRQYIAINF